MVCRPLRLVLLFAAQFVVPWVGAPLRAGLLFSAHFCFLADGPDLKPTWQPLLESSAHFPLSGLPLPEKLLLLSAAQFPDSDFPRRVVIHGTFCCMAGCSRFAGWGCYSPHILKRVVSAGEFPGFCTQDCYSVHNSLPSAPLLLS